MKKLIQLMAVLALLSLSGIVQANVFNLGAGFTNLETVTVGDIGNAADKRFSTRGYGSVNYIYNIGKYEVTAKQYTDFLNAKAKTDPYGLYNTQMAGGMGCNILRSGTSGNYTYSVADTWANRPVNFVSYRDSCRFANWLNNGQGNGDTEHGAYYIDGYTGSEDKQSRREPGAKWAIVSDDEWYKAAYYKGGNLDAGYWLYPTCNDIEPGQDMNDSSGNNANYRISINNTDIDVVGSPYWRTNAGEFQNSESPYGTFDQGGNVWEWTEGYPLTGGSVDYYSIRGGSYNEPCQRLKAQSRTLYNSNVELFSFGFRVVNLEAVPEPSSILAMFTGLVGLYGFVIRRRK